MINASVRVFSISNGTISKSGINIFHKTAKLVKKDVPLAKIFKRSGATIASNSVRLSLDEGVPRVGKL